MSKNFTLDTSHDGLVRQARKGAPSSVRYPPISVQHNATTESFMLTLHQGVHASPARAELYKNQTTDTFEYLQVP